MGIRGNFSRENVGLSRYIGGGALSLTMGNWDRAEAWKASLMRSGETAALSKVSIPAGYYPSGAWRLAITPGGMSSRESATGVAAFSGSIAAGRGIAGTFDGAASFTATGQLVVSGAGTFAGVAAFSGTIVAALAAAGEFAGAASFSGTATATGAISGTFGGVASFTATRYATGALAGSFSSPVELEAATFSSYLLDQEDIETGMTLRQALRLVAAATAGKISGAGSTTITIRNAVADSADRITATVDVDGNRTALTYDLAD